MNIRDHFTASGHLLHNTNKLINAVLNIYGAKPKARDIYTDWIETKADLLNKESDWRRALDKQAANRSQQERTIVNKYNKEFLIGDVLSVDLGYNVGHEYGGEHFCVVMKKSFKNDRTVIVLPLTSSDPVPGSDNEKRHYCLGEISFLNNRADLDNKTSYAKLESLLQVSKLRITRKKGTLRKRDFRALELSWHDFLSPYLKTKRLENEEKISDLEKEIERINLEKEELEEKLKDIKEEQEKSSIVDNSEKRV